MTLKFGKSPPSVLNPATLYINRYPLICSNSGNLYASNSSAVTFSSKTIKRSPVITVQPLNFSNSTSSFLTSTVPHILADENRSRKQRTSASFIVQRLLGKCSRCACALHRGERRTDIANRVMHPTRQKPPRTLRRIIVLENCIQKNQTLW